MKSRIRFSVSSIVVGAFVLATLIFAGLCAPMSALPQTTPRTLVAVLAHPDDESPAGRRRIQAEQGEVVRLDLVRDYRRCNGDDANSSLLKLQSFGLVIAQKQGYRLLAKGKLFLTMTMLVSRDQHS